MLYQRKHKVVFWSPGTLFSESSSYDIDSWDTAKAAEISKKVSERHGAKPYAFTFQTFKTHEDVTDGEGGFLKVQPKLEKESGFYFLTGTLETYDQIEARSDSKEGILRSNMYGNGHWIVCINTNSYKSTLPFTEKDVIVDTNGVVVERGDNPKYVAYRAEQEAKREDYYKRQDDERARRRAAEKKAGA